MGGIAREHGLKALAIGGTEDHVHILLSLPSSVPIAKAMREIKSAASLWMHQTEQKKASIGRRGTERSRLAGRR
jgi:REP element-mobilizing transposase RayT